MAATMSMLFRFSGIGSADRFASKLIELALPAKVEYRGSYGWVVETTTAALAHATALKSFIGKGDK